MNSSTRSSDPVPTNDVYLSFSGTDHPRGGFISNLYKYLTDAGVHVFKDDVDLRSGSEEIEIEILQTCRIYIIVFSKKYALKELEKIMECDRSMGQMAIPVFYDVDPSDVRYQRLHFGEAANISGFVLDNSGAKEAVVIVNIVKRVTSFLDSKDLFIAEYPVGVQSCVQDVIRKFNHSPQKVLAIYGMGGCGKTTIAKAVYNEMSCNFEGRMFLPNIRMIWEHDQVFLQQRLLNGISKTTETKIKNIESGIAILKRRLQHKRVLIVLDDVNKLEQLKALCGSPEWFGAESRIIITTRDKSQLLYMNAGVLIYHMKEMHYNESVELFSWYAFKKATPPKECFGLSKDVVSSCGGLPLALVALGHEFYGKRIEEWECILDVLKRFPHPEVQKVLKISFDVLKNIEKELFLDIAAFFIGMSKYDVIEALNGSDWNGTDVGIDVLEEKSLLTIDKRNMLQMHPLHQEMGREILREKSQTEPQQGVYDVFLSFRGEDTRGTFTSHLHAALENAGIYVFKDDDTLQRGEGISISLLKAIRSSKISIIVLSKNYANSRWCLQELENIMLCYRTKGQMVVPVFYEVNPSDVRHQLGEFGQAFTDLISKISVKEDKVLSWRTALREIGNLSGIVVANSRNENEDVKKIVEDVTHLLDKTELFVAVHPVGVTWRVQDVIEKLNNGRTKNVRLLGIWGTGGMGKTTIAKAIYNKIGRNFEGRTFLLNIRELWGQDNGPVILQERILSDIYKTTKIQIHNIESGKNILKERLAHKKVFLVLDDVNELDQLNALCGSREWFGSGSIIIITTRDKRLLRALRVDCRYDIEQMNQTESLELFCWHAFKQSSPSKEDFVGLSSDVVAYCQGLPLALEVLGSYLFDREITEWKSVLEKLKTIPNDEVHNKLKISFDGLSDETQKEMFLDIACFFIGMDRSDVVEILNGCGLHAGIGISILVERSLVTVDKNSNRLGMHDLLRDMGREIVRKKSPEPEERSRLWSQEEVLDVLTNHKGTKAIKGLALKLPRANPTSLSTKAFKKMKKLKLLQLAGVELSGEFEYLSRDLRWLNWHGFPLKHIPTTCYQGNLVAIELEYNNLKIVWRETMMLNKLKILNLSHSHDLRETPDFSYLPNLEKLILEDCPKLSSVSHTIGYLNGVLLINLKDCIRLRNLPRSIYKLKSLETLILSGCVMVDKLEEDLEQMESLVTLRADNTAIVQVPSALTRMKNIGYISLCGFEGLARDVIPSIIWSLTPPTNMASSLVQTSFGMQSSASLEPRPTTSQVSNIGTSFALVDCRRQGDIPGSKSSLSSFFIRMGIHSPITEILEKIISQKLENCGPRDCLLPGDKNPYWLTFNGEGSVVTFDVPQVVNGRNLITVILCVFYSSSSDDSIIISDVILKTVFIINQTECNTKVYEVDRLTSYQDEDWHRIISTLEPGAKVHIIIHGCGLTVKKTAVYLVYDEPIDQNMEHLLGLGSLPMRRKAQYLDESAFRKQREKRYT